MRDQTLYGDRLDAKKIENISCCLRSSTTHARARSHSCSIERKIILVHAYLGTVTRSLSIRSKSIRSSRILSVMVNTPSIVKKKATRSRRSSIVAMSYTRKSRLNVEATLGFNSLACRVPVVSKAELSLQGTSYITGNKLHLQSLT